MNKNRRNEIDFAIEVKSEHREEVWDYLVSRVTSKVSERPGYDVAMSLHDFKIQFTSLPSPGGANLNHLIKTLMGVLQITGEPCVGFTWSVLGSLEEPHRSGGGCVVHRDGGITMIDVDDWLAAALKKV